MAKARAKDPVMNIIRRWVDDSGLTLHELGLLMGCEPEEARQTAWQFLRTNDPHISRLRRFADAAKVSICNLLEGKMPNPPSANPTAESIASKSAEKKKGK